VTRQNPCQSGQSVVIRLLLFLSYVRMGLRSRSDFGWIQPRFLYTRMKRNTDRIQSYPCSFSSVYTNNLHKQTAPRETDCPTRFTRRCSSLSCCECRNRSPLTAQPRMNWLMTWGVVVDIPTTSSIPGSFGSAMLKPLLVIPTTTSRAGIPVRSRYWTRAWEG
jgi:hypothetical protein